MFKAIQHAPNPVGASLLAKTSNDNASNQKHTMPERHDHTRATPPRYTTIRLT